MADNVTKKIDMKEIRKITKRLSEMEPPLDETIYQDEKDLPRSMTIDTTTSITGVSKSKKPAGKVFSEGGEVEVMKGGDYIKDLID